VAVTLVGEDYVIALGCGDVPLIYGGLRFADAVREVGPVVCS
jgi:hypothetical protein